MLVVRVRGPCGHDTCVVTQFFWITESNKEREEWMENNPAPTRERERGPVSRGAKPGRPGECPTSADRNIDTAKQTRKT